MCGFACAFALGRMPDPAVVQRMSKRIAHRGPDDFGQLSRTAFSLGFRRLAILDLSPRGHQPLLSADGRYAIVFNGEVFNYLELRSQLQLEGHSFLSDTDTEVVLTSFIAWGEQCVSKFNGMFAFLIVELETGMVFGARDRFGVKPLYSTVYDDVLYLASEIKAFFEIPGFAPVINEPLIASALARGRFDHFASADTCFFSNVQEVPPGSTLSLRTGAPPIYRRYWDHRSAQSAGSVDDILALLTSAVELRLRSDVPIGVALSGGIDSNAILGIMTRLAPSDGAEFHPHAFSYIPRDFGEEPLIRDAVSAANAKLHETALTPAALWATLEDVLTAHDEPLHSPTALVGFQIYRLASAAGVKVVLGGQGADESFGGYHSYRPFYWRDLVRGGHLWDAWIDARRSRDYHGQSAMVSVLRALVSVTRESLQPAWFRRSYSEPLPYRSILSDYGRSLVDEVAIKPEVGRTLQDELDLSVTSRPLPLFLRIEDRNSMAHGVEARLPFMDYRLVTLARSLNARDKLGHALNKSGLRKAVADLVPPSVSARREKMGFPTPFASWLRHELRASVQAQLESLDPVVMPWIDRDRALRCFRAHVSGEDHSLVLFHVLQIDRWRSMLGI